MLSKKRIQRQVVNRQRRDVTLRLLVYVVLAAVCAAFWAGMAALVLRLSGVGVLAFGGAMFCATLFSIMVVCNGNTNKEAW